MLREIPTHLIGGPLGAGKTSLIRSLLAQKPAGERWAVLVNEFGEIGLDAAALASGQPLPEAQEQALEAAGWKRLAMVRNLELVRALFRRPLELWLLLDRCLYLVEQGYSVRLGEFCPTSLSPRNLLILAERS